jgi:HAD superfamily hydrolase (TIGR01509 family)
MSEDATSAQTPAAAVLFDMDGLLVDSEPLWTVAEVDLARQLGGTWSEGLKATVVGTRLDVAVPKILEWFGVGSGPDEVAHANDFLVARMTELLTGDLPLMPGALELVDGVRALGVPTGLVSSSYRALVDAALSSLGPHRFDITVAGDEVGHGKPSPEPYLNACARLEVDPSDVVIVEDAISGVESGEAAGATVVVVPWAMPIPTGPRRHIIGSLADIDPAWLVHHAPIRKESLDG